jgi:hypothetical protein
MTARPRLALGDVRPGHLLVRFVAVASALVPFALPLATAPMRVVAVIGLAGLLLAVVGIAGLWRWPITAAACVFLVEYTAALWMTGAPTRIVSAVTFGVSLLFLFASVELGRSLRRAEVPARVYRAQFLGWTGFAVATIAATMAGVAIAGAAAGSIPFGAAPFVAAVGAAAVILALAAAMTHAGRSARPSGRRSAPGHEARAPHS